MATNLQALAFEKAEILSSRLKEIISSGQGYIQDQLGLDLGLDPDVYPTGLLLSTAAAAALLLAAVLVLSWVAICGGATVGKTRGSSLAKARVVEEPLGADHDNGVAKQDEHKRKNKKKSSEKKGQSNGRQFSAPHEDTVETSSQQPPAERLSVKVERAPAQVKKIKKKAKAVVKPFISVITGYETEPEEGAWETQVSQRERKQQRKKDKGPEDAGSPGATRTAPKGHGETPAPPSTTTGRSRGPTGRKGDSSTNGGAGGGGGGGGGVGGGGGGGGGGRADVGSKPPGQSSSAGDREKWSSRVQRQRAQPEAKLWGQDKTVTRGGVESRTGVKPTTPQGPKAPEHSSLPVDPLWDVHPDDEWCGLNGAMAGDSGSDWSAPLVHWGHYEGPCSPAPAKGPSPKEVSLGEKAAEDSAGGTKSTKRRKKKNQAVDEGGPAAAAAATQAGSTPPKAHEAPGSTTKQCAKQPDSEKRSEQRSEQRSEPQRPGQKKRA